MTLGAIVVAYRDPAALAKALDSVAALPNVVVANVTADPSVAEVTRAAGRICLDLPENVGYAAAVNAAEPLLSVQVTDVLFMNDDVVVAAISPSWSSAQSVRVPLQRRTGACERPDLHPLPTPLRFIWHWVLALPMLHAYEGPVRPGTAANGAAIVVPRTLLRQYPLPEEYFLYWEETAWFWRLADAGIAPTVDRGIVVERPAGRDELPAYKGRLIGANLVRLGEERFGPWGRALYTVMGVTWTARCAVTDLLRAPRPERLRYRAAMLGGVLRGRGAPSEAP